MDFTEFSAKSVEEAITKACLELQVTSDQLDYDVISEGSNGFFGFGRKDAVIKARKKGKEKPVFEKSKPKKKLTVHREYCRHTWASSWTATADGPKSADCRDRQGTRSELPHLKK